MIINMSQKLTFWVTRVVIEGRQMYKWLAVVVLVFFGAFKWVPPSPSWKNSLYLLSVMPKKNPKSVLNSLD